MATRRSLNNSDPARRTVFTKNANVVPAPPEFKSRNLAMSLEDDDGEHPQDAETETGTDRALRRQRDVDCRNDERRKRRRRHHSREKHRHHRRGPKWCATDILVFIGVVVVVFGAAYAHLKSVAQRHPAGSCLQTNVGDRAVCIASVAPILVARYVDTAETLMLIWLVISFVTACILWLCALTVMAPVTFGLCVSVIAIGILAIRATFAPPDPTGVGFVVAAAAADDAILGAPSTLLYNPYYLYGLPLIALVWLFIFWATAECCGADGGGRKGGGGSNKGGTSQKKLNYYLFGNSSGDDTYSEGGSRKGSGKSGSDNSRHGHRRRHRR